MPRHPAPAASASPPPQADPHASLRQLLAAGQITQAMFDAALAASAAQAPSASADLQGGGAIAQGRGATAVGQGGAYVGRDNRGTINLGVLIEQARQPGASEEELQRAYLARLLRDHNHLPLLAGEQGAEEVLLSQVYTALLTQRQQADPEDRAGLARMAHGERGARPLSALAVLDAEPRLVLLAGPGAGKSTFVNVVAMAMAGELLGLEQPNLATLRAPLPDDEDEILRGQHEAPVPQPWQHGPLLPVLVVLRDLATRLPPPGTPVDAGTVWQFIEEQLHRKALGAYAPHLHRQLIEQGALVLFDGLDEVPQAHDRRAQIKAAVQSFAATFGRCRLLVTSRTYAYQKQDWKLQGFAEVLLRPFDAAQIRAFVNAWYAHMASLARLTPADARDRAETLQREIARSPRLQELAERPLLLTLIAQLQAKGGGDLPRRREALYDAAVAMLLHTWERLKPRTAADGTPYQEPSLSEFLDVGVDQIRRQLNRLAFEAHRDQQQDLQGSADIPQARLVQAMLAASPGNPDVKVARLQEYLRDRAGLLIEHGVEQVQFPHRSFQEYLAACHLTDHGFPDEAARLARGDPDRWREVALLAGAKAARGSEHSAWLLAETLCVEPAPETEGAEPLPPEPAWGARLAGQLLVESARLDEVAARNKAKLERIRHWQVALLRRPALPAVERAAAGRHLAVLGDPRAEVMTLEGMRFVWVPAGAFWMGDDDDARARPCHRVDLPYGYAIGRYPVTAAQWRLFAHATEHGDASRGVHNEPVARVSWHDALAFCRWLTDAWHDRLPAGWQVSLPSEAEWEKAARGGERLLAAPALLAIDALAGMLATAGHGPELDNPDPRRRFPWGDDFMHERANVELRLDGPSAVGVMPAGASPVGVEEMAGNVWEWTRSLWGKDFREPAYAYPYEASDARREDLKAGSGVLRVVRGGSWYNTADYARCAFRLRNGPDYRNDALGFRVVLRSSPVSRTPARRKR